MLNNVLGFNLFVSNIIPTSLVLITQLIIMMTFKTKKKNIAKENVKNKLIFNGLSVPIYKEMPYENKGSTFIHELYILILFFIVISLTINLSFVVEQTPNSGTFLNQTEQPRFNSQDNIKEDLPEEQKLSKESDQTIFIKYIKVNDNTLLDINSLNAITKKYENQYLTLDKINLIASEITELYRKKGYLLSRAIVPKQTLQDNILIIQNLEAKYDKIILENKSKVKDSLLYSIIKNLKTDEFVEKSKLDNTLLLLSDIPGIETKSVFKPGSKSATSELIINTNNTKSTTGNISVNNNGNDSTGKIIVSNNFVIFNPLKHGDAIRMNLSSSGDKLNLGMLSYDSLLNGKGTRIGITSQAVKYKLGDKFAALKAHGKAFSHTSFINHPLIRQLDLNLSLGIRYNNSTLKDHIDLTQSKNDRTLNKGLFSITANKHDKILQGGVSFIDITTTFGKVKFDNKIAELSDQTTGKTKGNYTKTQITFVKKQQITPKASLNLNLLSSFSSKNLDSSEKMGGGGINNVKSYTNASISSDEGYMLNLESRYNFGNYFKGKLEGISFVDFAYLKINKKPFNSNKNNTALRDCGVGLNWNISDKFEIKYLFAKVIGKKSSFAPNIGSYSSFFEVSIEY